MKPSYINISHSKAIAKLIEQNFLLFYTRTNSFPYCSDTQFRSQREQMNEVSINFFLYFLFCFPLWNGEVDQKMQKNDLISLS